MSYEKTGRLMAFSTEQLKRQHKALQEKLPQMKDLTTWKAFYETSCAIEAELDARGIMV